MKLIEDSQRAYFVHFFNDCSDVMFSRFSLSGCTIYSIHSSDILRTDPGDHKFPGLRDVTECWTFISLFQNVLRISWRSFGYPFIAALQTST